MAKGRNTADPPRRYRDFHAERVRERLRWQILLFAVFVLAGAAAVFSVIVLFNR